MKDKQKVIDSKYIQHNPARVVLASMVIWLFMDKFNTPGWVYGVVGTILGLAFIGTIIEKLNSETKIPKFED
jgi:hypothetical protein